MTRRRDAVWVATAVVLAVLSLAPSVAQAQMSVFAERITLLSETFDDLPYGENVQEGLKTPDIREAVYSPTGPSGWTVDNSQMPAGGVTEWAGWSFVDAAWWAEVGGDDRVSFADDTLGTIAVADPDEWDDWVHDPGTFHSFLRTPAISLAGAQGSSLDLIFDSSWKPEDTQTAILTASFDGGDPVEVLRWESAEASQFFHGSEPFEFVQLNIPKPAGAQEVVLGWGLTNAGDDWWWAIDNIDLSAGGGGLLFQEDFEGVALGPNVFEGATNGAMPAVWTDTPPEGWAINNENMAATIDDPEAGMREWEGWSFAQKDWWVAVAGDQRRSEFTNASGGVAIADPDEWDDTGEPPQPSVAGSEIGKFNSELLTQTISLIDVDPNSVQIEFDSSWRPEGFDDRDQTNNQTAMVHVSFDGGDPILVMHWDSDDSGALFHDHNPNEHVTLDVPNPEGAESMRVTFSLTNAFNDWWWAIDNVVVSGMGEPVPVLAGDINGDEKVDLADFLILKSNFGSGSTAAQGDLDADGKVNLADFLILKDNFGKKAGATAVPEPSTCLLLLLGAAALAGYRRRLKTA